MDTGENLSKSELKEMMNEADINHDGKIDYQGEQRLASVRGLFIDTHFRVCQGKINRRRYAPAY